ncbi:MAG: Na+/H+ antiporter subunit C, partial [Colwellia sp.]|nr:Na+/H+ antiporter subunit C [Colwellia sp.]
TAFVVILAIRGRADLGNDHVDGQLPDINNDIDTKGKL